MSYWSRLWEKTVKRILVLVALLVTALVLASAASANALKCAHGSSCNTAAFEPPTSASGTGTLPFTGLDLAGIAGVGALLLVAGLTLQRASRRGR
jgi:hypothetical protein